MADKARAGNAHAKDVMQQDIRAAGCIGAGIVAHHGIEAERGLYSFAFKPAVEEATRRFRKQVEHITLLAER